MAITAALVKELRERTGVGMMECKKALVDTDGDIDAAIEHMRKAGMAKADKKAGRAAAEGLVSIKVAADGKSAAIVEVNSETDFVAKEETFINFVDSVAEFVLTESPADLDVLLAGKLASGDTIEDTRKALIAKLGENMSVRRFEFVKAKGLVGAYSHGSKIAVLVDVEGGDADLTRDIAMHVAASRPVCVDESNVPQAEIDKEKEIYSAQAAESGKPAEIIEKMVQGRLKKFLKEITLMGQPFVKDPDQTIAQLVKSAGATIHSFVRLEVGEGIEKKSENFADEVMAQVKG